MKAIKVRYIGPTNTKPSRVTAHDADGNKVTISFNSYDSFQQAADVAVQKLLEKMEWQGEMVSGGYGEDLFYVFIPNVCIVCGKTGPNHGHYDAHDSSTHKYVSPQVYKAGN